MDGPRLTDEQRLQLESQRTEEWSPSEMGVWFGAEAPTSGTEVPDYFYELSPSDREVFEQTLRDAQETDGIRSQLARAALIDGMTSSMPGFAEYLVSGLADVVFDFLGLGVSFSFGKLQAPAKRLWQNVDAYTSSKIGPPLNGNAPYWQGIVSEVKLTPVENSLSFDLRIGGRQQITNWQGWKEGSFGFESEWRSGLRRGSSATVEAVRARKSERGKAIIQAERFFRSQYQHCFWRCGKWPSMDRNP